MELKELKEKILNNTLSDDFLILVSEDNNFIADSDIEAISRNKYLSLNEINSILEPQMSALSLVMNFNNNLNILRADTFEENVEDYSKCKNVIVICNKIDKRIEDKVSDYVVKIPKLTDIQLQDYVKVLCGGLDDSQVESLVKKTHSDIYRLDNEIAKISLFSKDDQKEILSDLFFTQDSDLVDIPVFELVDAIIKKDIRKIGYCLYYRQNCDFEPTGVITQLLKKYKLMLLLANNSGVTFDQLGISKGQAYYLKKDVGIYTETELRAKLKFVTEFDQKLKLGKLDINKESQIDYIISNILSLR